MTEQETQVAPAAPGKAAALGGYLLETRTEMEKVNWPPKDELIKATKAVLIGAGVFGIVIGLVDWLLQKILVDGVALLAR
ncbi:MAG TPA: preprotein translocase subunit SecE [Gemmatimonadales bacterium]|jgi:preprotein translocase SecE subunit|nr:preprotein translocase subunit SecE [Gemmatimonadales bacterium]